MTKATVVFILTVMISFCAALYVTRRHASGANLAEICQKRAMVYHTRRLACASDSAVIFIGDSHIEGLATSAITRYAENLGYAGDTSGDLRERIGGYKLLRFKRFVICIGANDILKRRDNQFVGNIEAVVSMLGSQSRILILEPPPFSKKLAGRNPDYLKIRGQITTAIRRVTSNNPAAKHMPFPLHENSHYMEDDALLLADGLHLSSKGYRMWIEAIHDSDFWNDSK